MVKKKRIKLSQIEKIAMIKAKYMNNAKLGVALQTGQLERFLLEIEAYECQETNGYDHELVYTYRITANEVREVIEQLVNDRVLCVEGSPEDFIQKEPETLFWYEESTWKHEWVILALKNDASIYDRLSSMYKEEFLVQYLIMHPSRVKRISHTDEDVKKAIRINPDVFIHLPKEQVSRELLYQFLQSCITKSHMPTCYYWNNIPEEYKDKVYYQGRAMLHPHYLIDVPKEYLSRSLINYIVEHISEKGYTASINALQFIPKEFLTEEFALKLCSMHSMGVAYIPEEFKNNSFYEKLIKAGQFEFLSSVDLTTISSDLILKCMKKISKRPFLFWQEKIPKTIWTKEIAHEYARISDNYYTHVPKKLWTREDCLLNLQKYRTIEDLPEEYWDEEAIDIIMQNGCNMLCKIPDKYKTDAFYKKYIERQQIYYKEIPEQYITIEVIENYIAAGKNIPFEKIPVQLITKDMIRKLFLSIPCYLFSQVHQNKEITTWIYEVIKEQKGKLEVQKYIYMLPHLTKEVINDMVEVIAVPRILKGMLNSYITQEMCDSFYEADPESIIYFPERFREKYRDLIGNEKTNDIYKEDCLDTEAIVAAQEEESKGDIIETFVQLSLFDFLN